MISKKYKENQRKG